MLASSHALCSLLPWFSIVLSADDEEEKATRGVLMLWSPTGNSKCDEENKVPTKFRRRRSCQTKQIRDFFRLGGDDGAVSCCC